MDRRGFFKSLLAVTALPLLAKIEPFLPERWRVGNQLLTPEIITREALRVLHQNLNFINTVNLPIDQSFKSDAKSETVTFRKPIHRPSRLMNRDG